MKTIATTALILTAGLFANTASAADPHLDDLAFSIKQQAALACREVRYGFRRTTAYPHLYKDFYELYTLADHVHEVAHNHGDLCHLKDDVEQMDALFHHTEEMLGRFTDPRTSQTCGTVSSYHFRRLQAIMVTMEDTIHHLEEDLHAELSPAGIAPPLPPGTSPGHLGQPALPPIPAGPSNPGFGPSPNQTFHRGIPQGRSVRFSTHNGKVAFSIRLGR